ncbi:MAG: hypothetical protein HY744_17245 [Deltaproteobacteria bacterium]|nr:hypothetical protein [Deltaproteobacteria bacterium]
MAAACLLGASCSFPDVKIAEDAAQCTTGTDCPASSEPCRQAVCTEQRCGFEPRAPGESCGDGSKCRADGRCAQCLDKQECSDGEACDDGYCVPSHCDNGQADGDESDVDCGGACKPCGNERGCSGGKDCASGYCKQGKCAACAAKADCAALPGTYCTGGSKCEPEKALGVECAADDECQSGHCAERDLVCCDEGCDGLCRGCRQPYTGVPTGQCGYVQQGKDPYAECPTELVACNGAGSCL